MAYSNVAPISALTARPWTRISRVPSITPTAWPGARVAGDRKEVRGGSGRQNGRPMLAARRFGVDLAPELAELAEGGFGEQSSQLERVDPLQRAVIGSASKRAPASSMRYRTPPNSSISRFCG